MAENKRYDIIRDATILYRKKLITDVVCDLCVDENKRNDIITEIEDKLINDKIAFNGEGLEMLRALELDAEADTDILHEVMPKMLEFKKSFESLVHLFVKYEEMVSKMFAEANTVAISSEMYEEMVQNYQNRFAAVWRLCESRGFMIYFNNMLHRDRVRTGDSALSEISIDDNAKRFVLNTDELLSEISRMMGQAEDRIDPNEV